MTAPDKLTVEEVQEMITLGVFYGATERQVLQQLADTMRENERLRGALQYVANGEDTTVEKLISDCEHYRNKHSVSEIPDGAKAVCAKCEQQIFYLDEHEGGCPTKT